MGNRAGGPANLPPSSPGVRKEGTKRQSAATPGERGELDEAPGRGGEGGRQPVREEGTKRQSAATPGEGEVGQCAEEGERQPFREEEMKRQSAATQGEGGVSRGAREGGEAAGSRGGDQMAISCDAGGGGSQPRRLGGGGAAG